MSDLLTYPPTTVPVSTAGPLPAKPYDDLPALLSGLPTFADSLPFMRPTLPEWDSLVQPIHEIIYFRNINTFHQVAGLEDHVSRVFHIQ